MRFHDQVRAVKNGFATYHVTKREAQRLARHLKKLGYKITLDTYSYAFRKPTYTVRIARTPLNQR